MCIIAKAFKLLSYIEYINRFVTELSCRVLKVIILTRKIIILKEMCLYIINVIEFYQETI